MRTLIAKLSHFLFASTCILIVGGVCYFSTLSAPFIWDDNYLIVNNPQIKDVSQWQNIFLNTIGTERVSHSFYRPLQMISYMADYILWSIEPMGYHLTNLLLHCFVAVCLMEFLWVLTLNRWTALFSSLLFVSHPIHTEAVAYVSGRADSLVAIFILLTVGLYVYAHKKKSLLSTCFNLFLSLAFFVMALLSKEQAVVIPFLMILYHVAYKSKIKWGAILPFLLLTIGYVVIRISGIFFTALSLDNPSGSSFMERLPGVFVALFSYIRLLLLPVNLHMGYGQQLFEFGDSQVLAGISIFVLMVILFIKQRRDYPLMSFAIGWFLIGLIPVLNIIPINAYMAEHWLYVPSMGYFILFGMFFGFIYRRMRRKWFIEIIFSVFLIFQVFMTVQQNKVWQDPVMLYNRIINHNPSFARAHYNLANALMAKGETQQAIDQYKSALQTNPRYADAHNNLGIAYQVAGDSTKAYKSFLDAIKANPHHLDANNNLGGLLVEQRRFEEASIYFQKVLTVNPEHPKTLNNLGILYARQGQYELAAEHLKRALAVDPEFGEAQKNLDDIKPYLKN